MSDEPTKNYVDGVSRSYVGTVSTRSIIQDLMERIQYLEKRLLSAHILDCMLMVEGGPEKWSFTCTCDWTFRADKFPEGAHAHLAHLNEIRQWPRPKVEPSED